MSAIVPQVAVVGAGWAGSRHVEAFANAGAAIAAIVDPAPHAAELATRHGARVLDTPDGLDSSALDLVVVALPVRMQPGVCAGLLRRGHRVLSEKPVAADLAAADTLAEVPGIEDRLMVGYTLVNHPAAQRLAEWVRGRRVLAVSVRSTARKAAVDAWRADPAEGGVVVINGIHAIDFAAALLDQPLTVSDVRSSNGLYGSPVPDFVAATLTGAAGAVLRLETLWSPWELEEGLNDGDWDLSVDIVTATGRALWRNWRFTTWERDAAGVIEDFAPVDLFRLQAAQALGFARGGKPSVGYRRARESTRVASAIVDWRGAA